jgi:hypothetical protein
VADHCVGIFYRQDAMNTRYPILLLAVLSLAVGPWTRASATVSRCTGADGGSIYTDGSCRASGGQPAPMSSQLLRALVREAGAASAGDSVAAPVATPASRGDSAAAPACSRTPGQLASTLRQTLGGGDVNDLAAVYDWTGVSGRQSRAILQKLERMSGRPLLDGHYYAASDGVVQLVQGSASAPTVTEMDVRRRAGCLLLAF